VGTIVRRTPQVFICLGIAFALAGCGQSTTLQAADLTPKDAQASLACGYYRTIMRGIRKGTLTRAEISNRLTEVDNASVIAPADIQDAATRILRTSTQDDRAAFRTAVTAMSSACAAAGS